MLSQPVTVIRRSTERPFLCYFALRLRLFPFVPPSLQFNFSPETRQIKQNEFGAGVIVIGVINLSFTVLAIMTVDKFEELWEPAAEKTQPASAQ